MSGYQIHVDDYAVLIAKSALLNAEVEAMKHENHERRANGMGDAYGESDFYEAMKPLQEQLERCKQGSDK